MRWGIVGYGWVARDHMGPAIRAAGGTVAAVADPLPDARARAEADGAAAFAQVADMLPHVDLVYVATPNDAHLRPTLAALAAGKPVLCEKPMAARLEDAEAMAAAATGKLAGTAFDQRWHPAHCALAARLAGDAIGRPSAVRIVYACWVDPLWSPAGTAPGGANWRADPSAAGGGATIDLALHGLDLAQMLLGEELAAVSMMLQRRIHDYAVDDGGMLVGRFPGGALLQAHVAYNCPEVLPRRRLEILGERGLIAATDTMGQSAGGEVTITCGRTGVESYVAFDTDRSPFEAQAAAFMAAARGEPHEFDMARDLRLMRRFDAAHREAAGWL